MSRPCPSSGWGPIERVRDERREEKERNSIRLDPHKGKSTTTMQGGRQEERGYWTGRDAEYLKSWNVPYAAEAGTRGGVELAEGSGKNLTTPRQDPGESGKIPINRKREFRAASCDEAQKKEYSLQYFLLRVCVQSNEANPKDDCTAPATGQTPRQIRTRQASASYEIVENAKMLQTLWKGAKPPLWRRTFV